VGVCVGNQWTPPAARWRVHACT